MDEASCSPSNCKTGAQIDCDVDPVAPDRSPSRSLGELLVFLVAD